MILDLSMLLGGGVLLYFGAEWLVGGASGLARSFGILDLARGHAAAPGTRVEVDDEEVDHARDADGNASRKAGST